MIHLSYQEAYVLAFVSQMKDCTDPRGILGLYVCHCLDDLQGRGVDLGDEAGVEEDLRQSGEELFRENSLMPVVQKLINLNLVDAEREKIFKHFSRVRLLGQANENDEFLQNKLSIMGSCFRRNDESGAVKKNTAASFFSPLAFARSSFLRKQEPSANKSFRRNVDLLKSKFDLNEFIFDSLQRYKTIENVQKLKSIIEVFNAKLFSFLRSFEREGEKFELRLFWPETIVPEVYDSANLFEEVNYKKNREKDLYLFKNENTVIKVRGDQLHEKSCTYDFYGIGRFTKKIKVDILSEERTLFESQATEIVKKRYLYKGDERLKIEFSSLKVQGEKWRTICIESPSLQTVLALSLLINPDHGEKLNYTAFTRKFYKRN
jgi:hypothetical protein